MTEPTDAELWQLYMQQPGQHKDPIDFARAALAKWGTPATVEVEPVAWAATSEDGDVEALGMNQSRRFDTPLYTTPQPTQPQAGAVPLTCQWTHNADDSFWDTECGQSWRFDDGGPKENNMHFCHHCGKPVHIKGGQHGAE